MATVRNSKIWLETFAFAVALSASLVLQGQTIDLEKQPWIHGSKDCHENKDAPMQVVKFDRSTYIIRQNKCLNYEAPFLYLLIGTERALLVDTGAESPDNTFLLNETVRKILESNNATMLPLIVIHSHGHSDHYGGDHQFLGKPNTRLIPPTKNDIVEFFQLQDWPETQKVYNLGQRELVIIPIPGHDQMSIAIYDTQTRWLLTGDTIYPGRLYIRDGKAFRASMGRLYAFAKEYPVSYIMGNHIEMTQTKGLDYPTGTLYQPDEHALPLGLSALEELYRASERMGDKVLYEIHNDFIIVPR